MNLTARRVATAAAGSALALSAFAASGSAAFAAKPGSGTPSPQTVGIDSYNWWDGTTNFEFVVPVAARSVQQIQCALDAQPIDCDPTYQMHLSTSKTADYWWGYLSSDLPAGEHTYSVTVTTTKSTYTGSTQFNTSDAPPA